MKALVAMSGGVDSAVAALKTLEKGYEALGCTLLMHGDDTSDAEAAASLAEKLGMKHVTIDCREQFRHFVIDRFVAEYEAGRTPNPCLYCNRHIKFGFLYDLLGELGCDKLVTGHYAVIERREDEPGRFYLKKAADSGRDQSYVLYNLTGEQLKNVEFPLGAMTKTEARAVAEEHGFTNAHKPDSQDICFVPDGDYVKVIERYCGRTYPAGDFVNMSGTVLGRHKGIVNYTLGQRRGLGLPMGERVYVCRIEPDTNRVVLGSDADMYSDELTAGEVNLLMPELLGITGEGKCREPESGTVEKTDGEAVGALDRDNLTAAVRYRGRELPVSATVTGEGTLKVRFTAPQRAITPGQAVVLYSGDYVVGGGIIG